MRVWFNRTFSSVSTAMRLIREADRERRYHLIYTSSSPVPAGQAAHQFELEPTGLKGEAYIDWCIEFCRRHDIGIFVPGKEARSISAARDRFADAGTRVLAVAQADALHLLHDKARFYATVDCPAAPPPHSIAVNNVAQFDAAYAELRALYPQLCIKPSESVYGLGFSVIDEERSCAELLLAGAQYTIGQAELRDGLAKMSEFRTMLVMEFLEGHEYSVDCVGDNGRLLCAVARRKPLSSGVSQTITVNPLIQSACAALAAAYGLNGVFNVQFRESGGVVRLLEINPRMSGGVGMACMAGPNLPYIALAGFDRGYDKVEIAPIREGMRVAEVSHAVEVV